MPAEVLPGIPLTAQRPNLLRHALTPPTTDNPRWVTGATWQPEICGPGGTYAMCDTVSLTLPDIDDAQDPVATEPYAIWTGDQCTTVGTDPAELSARAARSLAAQESHLVEQALWTGVTQSGTANIQALTDSPADPLSGSPVGVVTGIAVLLREMAATLGGARGMIHAPASLAPFLAFYGQAQRVNDLTIVSLLDHAVIFGTGYSGTAPGDDEPDDGVLWVYGSAWVEVRLGAVTVTPDTVAQAVDRSVNRVTYRAERAALHRFDPCGLVGVPICLPDPGPECDVASISPLSAGWDQGEWDADIWV